MKRLTIFLLIVFLILLVLPKFLGSYWLGIFIMIFFYAYLGQSWNILTGYTGVISLGHSLYVGIGAYMTFLLTLTLGLSPWMGMWIGGIAAGLIGLVIGFFGFRFGLKGVYFVLLTISFAEIGRLIVLHLKVFGSFQGLFITPQFSFANFEFRENTPYYYIALGYVIFSLIVVRIMERSKIGRYMVALREDEDAAESLGVNVFRYKMIAIFISAFMTSLAGAFYTNYLYYLHPGTMMSMAFSIEIILRPIIGGMGTVLGPVIGSFLITPLAELSRTYFAKAGYEGLHLVIYGFLLVAVVLFFPRGVISYIKKAIAPVLGSLK
ncbi:MAG TPA: branched-chain amino acid ABC transporter permease [Thermodesulfobacteriota bacterium]|nr:branched-chain amino acid ABC transporter permease [Thermodesulfobacteriota bacterium]